MVPTADTIHGASKLLSDLYPTAAEIQSILDEAVSLVSAITWRTFTDANITQADGKVYETIPDHLAAIAVRAVRLKTEELALGSAIEASEEAATNGRLRGFSAGPYSETYAGPGEQYKNQMITTNEALNEALWLLMTEGAKAEFIADHGGVPAAETAVTGFGFGPSNVYP